MFTEGKWEVKQLPITKEVYVACGTKLIAGALTEANARLIAQAPRLYEACKEAYAWLALDEHGTAKQLADKLDKVIAEVEKK